MRGTLHVVPADELAVFTGALDNRGEYAGAWLRAFDVTAKQMEALIDAIAGSLDGDCLTREELVARVEPRVGRWVTKRLRSGWGEFLKPAARRGVLCFGPSRVLPGFDPFMLFPHSDRPMPREQLERIYRKAAWVSATVVERGRVVGTWTHAKRGRKVELEVETFGPLAERTRAAVEREARSIARHVGGDLQLTWR